jgi:ubiquinone/menaquinone biosynthesis C-methylase UbiE
VHDVGVSVADEQVRVAYDTVAESYAELLADELDRKPLDRALLAAFAELVGDGPVVEVGCGPGRIAAQLKSLGVSISGVDLSPAMIAVARRRHPELRFDVGSMLALDRGDGTLAAIVAWYSTIHLEAARLPLAFAEFHRVVRPEGLVLLAFQVGDEVRHLTEGYGHEVSLDVHLRDPDQVSGLLVAEGFVEVTRFVREPGDRERSPQCFLLVRKAQPGTVAAK